MADDNLNVDFESKSLVVGPGGSVLRNHTGLSYTSFGRQLHLYVYSGKIFLKIYARQFSSDHTSQRVSWRYARLYKSTLVP
jgi:hypothetical protein